METNATQQQTIREYLLGRLPREEQTQFEERLLTDDEFYEELVIVEDELVDDYLRGELTATDRESFESHFVSAPEHQEKLSFARAFSKYLTDKSEAHQQESVSAPQSTEPQTADAPTQTRADQTRSRKLWFGFLPMRNPALGYAMAAVLVVMGVGLTWVVWRNLSAPRDPGRVLAVALTPGLSRGGNEVANRIVVPAGTDTLRLQLLLPENRFESYEATLLDSENRTLTTKPELKSESVTGQPAVVLDVEARLVPTGDYRVKLSGANATGNTESVATYLLPIQSR